MDSLVSALDSFGLDLKNRPDPTGNGGVVVDDHYCFPRCEYYSRFAGTSAFGMENSVFWRTYFRSTRSGGGDDRYSYEMTNDKKAISTINKVSGSGHHKSGAFQNPFFHKRYAEILTGANEFLESSQGFIYDDILQYKNHLCELLVNKFGASQLLQAPQQRFVRVFHANNYPCVLVSVRGFDSRRFAIDCWLKLFMCYFVAFANDYASRKGCPIEIVLRSSFGHNILSVDSVGESFRINIGLVPKVFISVLCKALKLLNSLVPVLINKSLSTLTLAIMNNKIAAYNKTNGYNVPVWPKESIVTVLDSRAVNGNNVDHVTVIHELLGRQRRAPDLLVDYISDSMKQEPIDSWDCVKPLARLLMHFDYSGSRLTLAINDAHFNHIHNKLHFASVHDIAIANDNKFWKVVTEVFSSINVPNGTDIANSVHIKQRSVSGIYAALEWTNLSFVRNCNSGVLHHTGGSARASSRPSVSELLGSDSDCEGESESQVTVHARKLIVATGMRAINVAAFLAFQEILAPFQTDCSQMYYETADAIANIKTVITEVFNTAKRGRGRPPKQKQMLFYDLNKCCTSATDPCLSLEKCLEKAEGEYPVVLDYTSATTQRIRQAIAVCLEHTKIVLLVSSGLKNEQAGADINPYGTVRIVCRNKAKLLQLYQLAQEVLTDELHSFRDYLPTPAHRIRQAYKRAGCVVTSKKLLDNHRKGGVPSRATTAQNKSSYWDYFSYSNEIAVLMATGFEIQFFVKLRNDDRALFLRLVSVAPRLLSEENIDKNMFMSLLDGTYQNSLSKALNFMAWFIEATKRGSECYTPQNLLRLIYLHDMYPDELSSLVNVHECKMTDLAGDDWSDEKISCLGGEAVADVLRDEEDLGFDSLEDFYDQNSTATARVLDKWAYKKTEMPFETMFDRVNDNDSDGSGGNDASDDFGDEDSLDKLENEIIEDGCPAGWFPKGWNGSDSDADSGSDNENYYNQHYLPSDEEDERSDDNSTDSY